MSYSYCLVVLVCHHPVSSQRCFHRDHICDYNRCESIKAQKSGVPAFVDAVWKMMLQFPGGLVFFWIVFNAGLNLVMDSSDSCQVGSRMSLELVSRPSRVLMTSSAWAL